MSQTAAEEQVVLPPGTVPTTEIVADSGSLRLVPVQATETGIDDLFDRYAKRVDPRLGKTLDCSWKKLKEELAKDQESGLLEWHWVMPEGGSSDQPQPEQAEGLVVFRFVKGSFANFAQLHHLSVAGPDFVAKLGRLADLVRRDLFQQLSIAMIRATLWYSEDESGKFVIDPDVEALFKERGFRWYQLTQNPDDGKRGQVMNQKRNAEVDPAKPQELLQLDVKMCLLLPLGAGGFAEDPNAAGAPFEAEGGSQLLLVDCVRRYELEKDKAEKERKAKEEAEGDSPPAEEQPLPPDSSGAVRKLVNTVGDQFGLKSLPLICTKVVPVIGEGAAAAEQGGEGLQEALLKCEGFCGDLLGNDPTGASFLQRNPLPKLSKLLADELEKRATTEGDQKLEMPASVVCGMLSVTGNTLPRRQSAKQEASSDAGARLSLPVMLVGTSPTVPCLPGEDRGLVFYVGTSDDDLSLVLWSYPADAATASSATLAAHCASVLSSVEQVPQEQAAREISLPSFSIRGKTALSGAVAAGAADEVKGAQPPPVVQLLEASFVAGRPQPGALLSGGESAAAEPRRLEGPFVFCVCHANLETLDRPLFAVVVDPALDLS